VRQIVLRCGFVRKLANSLVQKRRARLFLNSTLLSPY
jgi:hypothetical protein